MLQIRTRTGGSIIMKTILICVAALALPWALVTAQQPPAASGPTVTIALGSRQSHASPSRQGFTHTGGGNIDVAQPAPDTLVITMTGVAVAGKHPWRESVAALNFDLVQSFEVGFEKPEVKKAKLTIEGRLIGLLRGTRSGTAGQGPATAHVSGPEAALTLAMPGHHVACGESLSINDRQGPVALLIGAGQYTLNQSFAVTASHPRDVHPSKAASAEFAPDPALDPLWISYWEPFHGAAKKDFGFQVTIKVAPAQ
jgi:hypothetical protein